MRRLALSLTGLIALVALLAGCTRSSTPTAYVPPSTFEYHAYTHQDSLMANFVLVWEHMDHAEYRDRILYDGIEQAPDGETYAPFVFYFIPDGLDIWGTPLPPLQDYAEEEANIQRLFSGCPGKNDVPGVRSIELDLIKNSDWAPPTNSQHVEDDPYPEGTLRCVYTSDMLVTLKGTVPGSDTTGFLVNDDLEFHVIPVLVDAGTEDEHTEYRLWKWRDIGLWMRATAHSSWSSVKALY